MNRTLQNDRSILRRIAASFFVLVLLVFTGAEAIHAHAAANRDNPRTETHCLLCVAGHSAVAPAQTGFIPVTFSSVIIPATAEPQLYSRLSVPSAFIRPPPENL